MVKREGCCRTGRLVIAGGLGVVLTSVLLATLSGGDRIVVAQEDPLGTAWKKARDADTYRFDAEVSGIVRPLAEPGAPGEGFLLALQGAVDGPRGARMRLWGEGGSMARPDEAVELLVVDGKAYVNRNGEWEETEANAGSGTLNGQFLVYIQAARDVQPLEPVERGGATYRRYRFTLDGERYAQILFEEMLDTVRGQAPPGVELQPSEELRATEGEGEVWLDAEGYPARLLLQVTMPRVNRDFGSRSEIKVDFSAFGEPIDPPILQPGEEAEIPVTHRLGHFASLAYVLPFLFVTVDAGRRRRRYTYPLVVVVVILSMFASPFLQNVSLAHWNEPWASLEEDHESATLSSPPQSETPKGFPSPNPFPVAAEAASGSGTDTDNDGLSDGYEEQLGTNPYQEDTDLDQVSDAFEVQGFDYDSQHWHLNPFRPDTNDDGLPDYMELPEPYGELRWGEWDTDDDHTPDVWDTDNDGDGVVDGVDASPFSYASVQSGEGLYLRVRKSAHTSVGPTYIEVQVRPTNPDHLRYYLKKLDWPYDAAGQMQDVNNSGDDITLIPMLEIETDMGLSEEAKNKYGLSTIRTTADTRVHPWGAYKLYVPLYAVQDGGRVVAFHGKAFYPADSSPYGWNMHWHVRLVWVVQAKVDECQELAGGGCSWHYDQKKPVQVYYDDFTATGVVVTRNEGMKSVFFHSTDLDDSILPLAVALEPALLRDGSTGFDDVIDKFKSGEQDWGIDPRPAAAGTYTYSHTDEGIADNMSSEIPNALEPHGHAASPYGLFVYQNQYGASSLDGYVFQNPDANRPSRWLTFRLDNLGVLKERGFRLARYSYDSDDGWQPWDIESFLDDFGQTHAGELDEIGSFLWTGYLLALAYGQYRTVGIDGQAITDLEYVYDEVAATIEDYTQLGGNKFLKQVFKIKEKGLKEWAKKSGKKLLKTGLIAAPIIGVALLLHHYGVIGGSKEQGEYAVGIGLRVWDCVNCLDKIKSLKKIKSGQKAAGFWYKAGVVLEIVLTVVVIGLAWYSFYKFSQSVGPNEHPAYWVALGQTIAMTAWALVTLIIGFTIAGAIALFVIAIVGLIVWLVWGEDMEDNLITALGEFLVSADFYVAINSVDFGGFEVTTQDAEEGIVQGNAIDYRAAFTGVVQVTGQGKESHVSKASVSGRFDGSVSDPALADVSHWESDPCCTSWRTGKECTQTVALRLTPHEPKVNLKVNMGMAVSYKLPGYVCYAGCYRKDYKLYEDTVSGDKQDIYYDVFPQDIDGFITWTELSDDDRDGDGLPNDQDPYPDNPDQDGDGLSDYVERKQTATGLNDSDSDDDGLSDYDELRWSTDPKDSDTDRDGVTDGDELAGWEVDFRGYYDNFWALPSPTASDIDWDGVLDGQEREQQTNPWGATFAIGGSADFEPRIEAPGSVVSDTIRVFNPTATAAENLAIVATLPTELLTPSATISSNVTLNTISSLCLGPSPSGSCIWQAGGLPGGEEVLIYLTATIDPAIVGSHWASGTMTATARLIDQGEERNFEVSAVPRLGIDAEPPTSTVDYPAPAGFVGGITVTLAGTAQDEISWVDRVDVRVTGVTSPAYDTGWREAEGTEGWEHDWGAEVDSDYALQSRAADPFGHVETPATVTFTVDNTAPTVAIGYPSGGEIINPPQQPDGSRVFTVTGSADDRFAAPRVSGVEDVYLGVDYVKPSAAPPAMGSASLPAAGQPTSTWEYPWTLPAVRTDRVYTLTAQAADGVGNLGGTDTITVGVDTTAPGVFFDEQPDVIGTSPITLSGFVWDVPPTLGTRPGLWLLDRTFHSAADLSAPWSGDTDIAVSPAGDTNGDGYDDFLLLASGPVDDEVYLVLGRLGTGWPSRAQTPTLFEQAATVIVADLGEIQAVSTIGDYDDDGYDDFAIAVYDTSSSSLVYLVPGRPESQWQASMTVQQAGATILNSGTTYSLRAAGDTNDDGHDDFLIKASSVAQPVVLLLGRSSWATQPDSVVFGAFESTIERADSGGDLNDDGLNDVVVAGGNDSDAHAFFGHANWGQTGYDSYDLSAADVTLSAQSGFDVRMLGDVNGDGYGDLAVFDVVGSSVEIYVIPGAESMSDDTLENAALASFIGVPFAAYSPESWVGALGDVNGDGLADFAIGSQGYESPPTGAYAYLIFGTRAGWALDEDVRTSDLVAGSYRQSSAYELWHSVFPTVEWIGLGDLDGDGFADFGFTTAYTADPSMMMYPLGGRRFTLYFGRRGAEIPTAGVDWVRVGLRDHETGATTWTTPTLESPGSIYSAWAFTWTPPLSGTFDLLGQAADLVGNVSDVFTGSQTLVVDRIAPTVELLYPDDGATLYEPVLDFVLDVSEGEHGSGVAWAGVLISDTMGITQTITATLRNDGRWFARWQAVGWQYDVEGLARDEGGSTGHSDLIAVTVELTTSSSITSPLPYQGVGGSQFAIQGWAHTDGWPLSGVEVRRDGAHLGDASPVDPMWSTDSAWVYTWTLPGDGQYVLTSWASDVNGFTQTASIPVTVTVDNAPPAITLTHPVSGTHVALNLSSEVYTITGQASDATSGVSGVSVRVGDSAAWESAALDGPAWAYTWTLPAEDTVTHTVAVEATDRAGHAVSQTFTAVVDRASPTGLELSAPDAGSWVAAGTTVVVTWTPGVDGSGVVTPYAAWTQVTSTFPITSPDAATAHTETLSTRGAWTFHLRGTDGAGNSLVQHHGPITVDDPSWPGWAEIDGVVDSAHGEWDSDEYLGSDSRSGRGAQSFYATWDGDDLYFAWQGARWDADGDLFAYLGTGASTTTTMNYSGTHTLPFGADYAFYVEDESTYGLKEWNGASWVDAAAPGLDVAFDPGGGAEVAIPRPALGDPSSLHLLAFAQEEQGSQVWAAFPNVNPLGTGLTFTHGFYWAGLGQSVTPGADQPIGVDLAISLGATDYGALGSSGVVTYALTVENESADSAPSAVVTATAEGLAFTGVEGATCADCPGGGSAWLLSLGDLEAESSRAVTLTAGVNLGAGAFQPVTTTVQAACGHLEQDGADNVASLSHDGDTKGPDLGVVVPSGNRGIRPGLSTVAGSAADDTGLSEVQVSLDGSAWQPVSGTLAWSRQITVSASGQITLHVKGWDVLGNEAVTQTSLVVDGVAPASLISLEEGTVLSGDTATVYGVAYDSHPAGGEIDRVEISTDGGSTWEDAGLYAKGSGYLWVYEWLLPESSGLHTLMARATDGAGNEETPGAGVTVFVWGEAPRVYYLPLAFGAYGGSSGDHTAPTSYVATPGTAEVITTTTCVITGTASDAGSGVAQVQVSTDGGSTWQVATGTSVWTYDWTVAASGLYTLTSRARDWAGNVETPHRKVYVFTDVD